MLGCGQRLMGLGGKRKPRSGKVEADEPWLGTTVEPQKSTHGGAAIPWSIVVLELSFRGRVPQHIFI